MNWKFWKPNPKSRFRIELRIDGALFVSADDLDALVYAQLFGDTKYLFKSKKPDEQIELRITLIK